MICVFTVVQIALCFIILIIYAEHFIFEFYKGEKRRKEKDFSIIFEDGEIKYGMYERYCMNGIHRALFFPKTCNKQA